MKVVLFDVMSTLVYDPFYIELPKAFNCSLSELLRGRDRYAWLEFERNEINEEQFYERFFQETALVDGPKMTNTIFENYRYLDGIEDLLASLQGKCRLTTLSNYPIWFEHLKKTVALERYMNEFYVSYQLGVRKPHPDAYLIPAQQMGVSPEDCIFVDDRQENCDAAIDVGMTAILFKDAKQLTKDLQFLGLL